MGGDAAWSQLKNRPRVTRLGGERHGASTMNAASSVEPRLWGGRVHAGNKHKTNKRGRPEMRDDTKRAGQAGGLPSRYKGARRNMHARTTVCRQHGDTGTREHGDGE